MNENLSFEKLQLQSINCELSFYEFFKHAWPHIEGIKEFKEGRHIYFICEHLEAVAKRQIKNLLINIPPRSSKTSLVSIAFPAWVWLMNPHEKFMYGSYAQSLSLKHSVDCRRLIQSDWYQQRWGNRYQLMKDQNTKGRFDNNQKGYRIATSVNGSVTGEGASILICFPYPVMVISSLGSLPIGRIVEEQILCTIFSYNHTTKILEYKEIESYEKNVANELLEIEFEDGSCLECTEDHPIFIEGKGYILAKDIEYGDIVLSVVQEGNTV